MKNAQFESFLARKRREYGAKFDSSDLAEQFIPFYESNERIEVETAYEGGASYIRRGRVGITTGWKPVFLLMHRVSDHGSGDTLGAKDRVLRIIAP